MAYVYILQSLVNSRYYIGSTNDLERRLKEHSEGKSIYTKLTRPFKLVFSQQYSSISEARKIEFKLKKAKSKVIIEKIIAEGYIRMK